METHKSVERERAATSRVIAARYTFQSFSIAGVNACNLCRGLFSLRLLLILTICAVGLMVRSPEADATGVKPFTVSTPTVTGPIPSTSNNFPFIADGFSVAPPVPDGWAEAEYFVSGTANIYEFTKTGVQIVSPCPPSVTPGCTNIPYTTRLLVKYPTLPGAARFNGTVIIEPLNPSANFDGAVVWDRSRDYFVRSGTIFVGWTSKSVAVNTLKTFNPERYAPLNWPYVPFVAGGNNGAYDGITWDIAAQIGALFKTNGPASPTHNFNVQRVFEAGFSQDGSFAFTQADVFHELERLPGGGPIYDGYNPGGTGGPSDINFGLTPAGALPLSDPRQHMQPRDVPVIQTNTETEEALFLSLEGELPYRRPDSDALNDRYRLWEVPGASHADADVNTLTAGFEALGTTTLVTGCAHQGIEGVVDPNDFPFKYVLNGAFAALTAWVAGVPPPHANRIQLTSTSPKTIARDEFGNALGGLRTPFVDVPITTYSPTDTGPGFCILFGYNTPFGHDELQALYTTHADYVSQVVDGTKKLVGQHFWNSVDAQAVELNAQVSNVP